MKQFIVSCYLLIIVCLAATTFVEKAQGTPFVNEHIYHSFWFIALWGILSLSACWYCLLYTSDAADEKRFSYSTYLLLSFLQVLVSPISPDSKASYISAKTR